MSTVQTIFQCTKCRRFMTGSLGMFRVVSLSVGEGFAACRDGSLQLVEACGLPDCDDAVKRNTAIDTAARQRRIQRFNQMRRGSPRPAPAPARPCHRGMPAEAEGESFESAIVADAADRMKGSGAGAPGHMEHVSQFNAQASARDEAVLAVLGKSFDLNHPEVPGQWVTGFYFLQNLGIKAANSCAARLRNHPFVIEHHLDVDSGQVPAAERAANPEQKEWWRYRLCRTQDSERLKRDAAARERRQG